jgi:hypothetical protein
MGAGNGLGMGMSCEADNGAVRLQNGAHWRRETKHPGQKRRGGLPEDGKVSRLSCGIPPSIPPIMELSTNMESIKVSKILINNKLI